MERKKEIKYTRYSVKKKGNLHRIEILRKLGGAMTQMWLSPHLLEGFVKNPGDPLSEITMKPQEEVYFPIPSLRLISLHL